MQSFLCDGYNGQNSLLDPDDCLAQQKSDEGEDVSFQQQTPENYS